jgi:hypothetical protein
MGEEEMLDLLSNIWQNSLVLRILQFLQMLRYTAVTGAKTIQCQNLLIQLLIKNCLTLF